MKKENIKAILGVLLFFIAIAWCIHIKVSNIDMTNMRLMTEYWKSYVVIIIMGISGYYMTIQNKKERGGF